MNAYEVRRATKLTTFIAVRKNKQSKEFANYVDACDWLDDQDPEYATAGFICKDQGIERGYGPFDYQAYLVRHAE